MKIVQASFLLFFATNAASFGLHRLFRDMFNSQTGQNSHHGHSSNIQSSGPTLLDAMLWDEIGDSGSSEEGGLYYLFHMLNNYDTGDYPVPFETTTSKIPRSTTETNIDDTTSTTPTETPTKSTTEMTTGKPRTSTTVQPSVTTEGTAVDSTTVRTSEEVTKSSVTPMETTAPPDVAGDSVTTQSVSTESFTTSSASTTSQSSSSESSPTTSTTTPYSITTEDTFIEGDLSDDKKVNKTDLNSTDDITKIVDEYNDYIDEGPTRGDLHSNTNKGLNISSDVNPTQGSGIIDEYLSNLKITKHISINSAKESTITNQKGSTAADISVQNIGNIPFDQAIQSLNNKMQSSLDRKQNNIPGISGDIVNDNLGNDITNSVPKPTVFFTLPSSQNTDISKSQQNIFSERVARIGNDFVILPDFNNGAVLLEPIVSSGNIKTNTIPNFEYVPPKTLSFEAIPNSV